MKNNKRDGYGIKYYSNGNRYEGEFKNDNKDGYGIYLYSNGDKYEGERKNNKRDGYGIKYYSNGNRYEGEFKNDIKMDMEYIFIQMEINMKDNRKIMKKKDME